MGSRKRRFGHDVGSGNHAKESHKKRLRSQSLGIPNATALNARPEVPNLKLKHHSYYEIVENKDKKKKLEFQITNRKTPPPGFEFVPIGNPELTTACKEISREQDAMIFIVSSRAEASSLSQQLHRIGHHIRETIVEEARKEVSGSDQSSDDRPPPGVPEPIPETQAEIDEQADKAIRDLFPRIPHTDRRTIIEHSFKKGATKKGEPLVGLAQDIPLSRRVQLAVLAHIRHTHTRYDKLLRETTYINARKAVEQLCLEKLVKWRGDEETGRDQLDEIFREVIVISDSEGEEDDDEDLGTDTSGVESGDFIEDAGRPRHRIAAASHKHIDSHLVEEVHRPFIREPYPLWHDGPGLGPPRSLATPNYAQGVASTRKSRRGFKRYQAALAERWVEAKNRVRLQENNSLEYHIPAAEQMPYTRYESVHQDYRPSPAALRHDFQDVPDQRGIFTSSVQPHPLEFQTRAPVQAMSAAAPHRSFSDGISRSISPYTGARQQIPAQRASVKSDEARDFLVPSVEPPFSEPRPTSVDPIFVRTVSPRQASRVPRDFLGQASEIYGRRGSPSWIGEEVVSVKRRRAQDDEHRSFLGSPRQDVHRNRRQVYGEQRVPVYNTGEFSGGTPLQNPSEYAPQLQPRLQPLGRAQVPPPKTRAYDEARAEPPYGTQLAVPLASEHWETRPDTAYVSQPVVDHGHSASERRETHTGETGWDARFPYVIEEHQDTPMAYGHRSTHARHQLLQERPPFNPNHKANYNEPYSYLPPSADAADSRPVPYHSHVQSAPPFQQQHGTHLESAPVLIRQVQHYDQPNSTGHYSQGRQQRGVLVIREDHVPEQVNEAWQRTHVQDARQPRFPPLDGMVLNPPYPRDWRHAPPENEYPSQPRRQDMQYYHQNS